jgi:glycosyltransferase involved in cell wall biosynthesis
MAKLLMISGDRSLAEGKRGAFYNNLMEYARYWERIDIITPRTHQETFELFGNVHIYSSDKPLLFHPWFIKKTGEKIFDKQKFDIIAVHEYAPFYNGLGAWLLWWKIKVPYVLEFHHLIGVPRAANFKEYIYRLLNFIFIRLDVKNAFAVRATSDFMREELQKINVAPEKIKVIPSFYIDMELFKPVPEAKIYDIVTSGRLAENKGIDLLLKAVALIKKKKPDVKLAIIGDGPLKKRLSELAKKLGLEKNIHFTGWLPNMEDLPKFYNQSRVFALTSYNEGGPRVTLEALACGLPVVSTPVGLMTELLKDGENGLLIDWNAKDIAEKIEKIIFNPEIEKKFSNGGRERILKYSKPVTAKNYAMSYQQLAIEARSNKKDLLIICHKVDENDDLLGFFIGWLKEFSKKFNKVFVITLEKGEYELPSNIEVYSLGKEKNNSRISRAIKFYKLLFKIMPNIDGVFAHMSAAFVIYSWPVAFFYRKKIIWWYLHRAADLKHRLAGKLSFKIVTASAESLNLKNDKIIETGHGIDIEKFAFQRQPEWPGPLKILSVGRISPIKNYETLIRAAAILKEHNEEFEVKIIGRPVMPKDNEYLGRLKKLVDRLELKNELEFIGLVPYRNIAAYYLEADYSINLTPKGGLDKSVLEAMAAGCIVLTSNKVFEKYLKELSGNLIFEHNNSSDLAQKIERLAKLPLDARFQLRDKLVKIAAEHSISEVILNIASVLNK